MELSKAVTDGMWCVARIQLQPEWKPMRSSYHRKPTSSVIYDGHLTPQFLTSAYRTWLAFRIVRAPSGVDSWPGSVVSVVVAGLSLRLLPLLSVC